MLKNILFKQAFANFLIEEWKKPPIIRSKIVYISHGWYMKVNNKEGVVEEEVLYAGNRKTNHLQCQYEEAS